MTAVEVLNIPCVKGFDPAVHVSPEARALFRRACDLKARFFLNRIASEESERGGDLGVVALLVHAEIYLSDRLAYELYPPPSKMAIPLQRPWRGVTP
jgi:hypothetical protein